MFILMLAIATVTYAENINYTGNWGDEGLTLKSQSDQKLKLNFSIHNLGVINTLINGATVQEIALANVFLPNDEGAPNLPGISKFIAIPNGASAHVEMLNYRIESYDNIEMAPAPRIPWDTERGPLEYNKNPDIYSKDAFYPSTVVQLSELTEIRGFNAAVVGITPFQYNPVTKELLVYRDVEIEITFEGGTGQFGQDRLRSRHWDPLLRDIFINEASIPAKSYNKSYQGTKDVGCEYLIITPNDAIFQSWADSIKQFRILQGIMTDIMTIDDVGGNTTFGIENFVNDAYNNWDVVPAAILLLGDYGTNGNTSIISPIWDNYCVSDNILADVTGNDMPDIIFARMTAQDEAQLEIMITKFLDYERTPPTSEDFYNHPITALGWQTERWFQICSETIGGFWRNTLGKEPVRINEVYGGNPDTDPWSTATNTYTILNVFGPNGLDYIPSSPSDLGNWAGGGPADVTNAINDGAFVLQHRDHGYEYGWGEPGYANGDIDNLTNTDLSFIFSVNCLTGKYNLSGECFAEKFHRHTSGGQNSGALGLIAASEVSYSFVNDTYVWGMYDNLWPDFLPQFGAVVEHRGVKPAFGNAAGKYFLHSSSWPYNTGNKEVTYNLFHHHGDAFLTLYTEVPQEMTIIHNPVLLEGSTNFTVFANEGAFICLTVNGEIIGTAESEGDPVDISIPAQNTGDQMIVTVTRQDYYRVQQTVDIIDSDIAYIVQESVEIIDENANGQMDYGEDIYLDVGLENIGTLQANNVSATLSTVNPFITITDDSEVFGDFSAGSSVLVEDAFALTVDNLIPDMENVFFEIEATDGTETWVSQFVLVSHAPVLEFVEFTIDDQSGNNNGRIDPGETVDIEVSLANNGTSEALLVTGELLTEETGITVNTSAQAYGSLSPGASQTNTFTVVADAGVDQGTQVNFTVDIEGDGGISGQGSFMTVVGKYTALVLDLDPLNYSGPEIYNTFGDMEIYTEYMTSLPDDLNLYKNVFVCLGLHFTNYELSDEEGQILKDFILAGGNLYMEGRVTWDADPQTPVHPMFNINVVDLSMYLIGNVIGVPGAFTGNMQFGYEGNNAVNDYSIEPIAPAFSLFSTSDPEKGCMVAYNEGTYRTIGSTIEFGKLTDGSSPSTKEDLMQQFLLWFDGVLTDIDLSESYFGGKISMVCQPNPFSDVTNIQIHVEKNSEYTFEILDLNGKNVKSFSGLSNETDNQIIWDGTNNSGIRLSPGVYIGMLRNLEQTQIIKLIITK